MSKLSSHVITVEDHPLLPSLLCVARFVGVELVFTPLDGASLHTPEWRAKNPLGRSFAFKTAEGVNLFEAASALRYLLRCGDARSPGPPRPSAADQHVIDDCWVDFAILEVAPPTSYLTSAFLRSSGGQALVVADSMAQQRAKETVLAIIGVLDDLLSFNCSLKAYCLGSDIKYDNRVCSARELSGCDVVVAMALKPLFCQVVPPDVQQQHLFLLQWMKEVMNMVEEPFVLWDKSWP